MSIGYRCYRSSEGKWNSKKNLNVFFDRLEVSINVFGVSSLVRTLQ